MKNFDKSLIFLAGSLLISVTLFSQTDIENSRSCGSDFLHVEKMLNDDKYKDSYTHKQEVIEQLKQEKKQSGYSLKSLTSNELCSNPVVIPVAVHYQNVENPDYECLKDLAVIQIQILNDDFQGVNADITKWTDEAADFFPGINNGQTCVEFCLATNFHPEGYGAIDGEPAVTINQGTSLFYSDWSGYLNIYVDDYDFLGISPLGGNGNGDGVGVDHNAFGSGDGCEGIVPSVNFGLGRTLSHEVGHFFNLPHIWGSGCASDDGIEDTPDSEESYYGCPTIGEESCGSTDMHMNYMDYCWDECLYMFSEGQSRHMEMYIEEFLSILVNNNTVCSEPNPNIQFSSSATEIIEGTSNCNTAGSQSYEIDLFIATEPSADAVVIFETGGTVNENDFEISPSSVIFPAGEKSTQIINVTVYEDAYLESDETLTINYTINSNGGDAVASTINQTHTVTIINDDFLPTDSIIILMDENFDSGLTGWTINDNGSNDNTWGLSTGIEGASSLNGSQFMIVNSDAAGTGSTSDEELLSPILNAEGMTDIILSFEQFIRVYDEGELETFNIDIWDGTTWKNVLSRNQNDGNLGSWAESNFTTIDISEYANENLQVRFTYNAADDWYWAIDNIKIIANSNTEVQVENNVNDGYAENELGPFETVHFYDVNTGNIMLTIENTTNYDYGCTRVEIDQSASGSSEIVLSNAPSAEFLTNKSFRVIPSNNSDMGTYIISLYYTEEEISLWESTTGIDSSELKMVKSSEAIADATSLELIDVSVADFIGDYIYTASINTGFSGFSLGNSTGELSIDELEKAEQIGFAVYPNPFQSDISVEFLDSSLYEEIKIFSIDGKLILNEKINKDELINLDMQHLSAGLYLIGAYNKKGEFYIKKMIKTE